MKNIFDFVYISLRRRKLKSVCGWIIILKRGNKIHWKLWYERVLLWMLLSAQKHLLKLFLAILMNIPLRGSISLGKFLSSTQRRNRFVSRIMWMIKDKEKLLVYEKRYFVFSRGSSVFQNCEERLCGHINLWNYSLIILYNHFLTLSISLLLFFSYHKSRFKSLTSSRKFLFTSKLFWAWMAFKDEHLMR